MKKMQMGCWLGAGLAAMAMAAPMAQAQTTVYAPELVQMAPFNYSTGADGLYITADDKTNQWGQLELMNSGTAAITTQFPKNGDGSLVLTTGGNGVDAKAGVGYYPNTRNGFGTLSSITAASFQFMRAATAGGLNPAPVMRLYLFVPGTDVHVATLMWVSGDNGVAPIATDAAWQTANVSAGGFQQTKNTPPRPVVPGVPPAGTVPGITDPGFPGNVQYFASTTPVSLATLQSNLAFGNLIVRAVEVGIGRGGWTTDFVGAVDSVVLSGGSASVNANFEVARPAAVAVPTLGEMGIAFTGLLLAGAAAVGVRRRQR